MRARWEDPRHLRYAFTDTTGPLPTANFQRLVERAFAAWTTAGAGCIGFERVAAGERPDVTVGWLGEKGDAGGSPGFVAWSGVVAHTGPVSHGTFMRFFSGVHWSEEGPQRYALFQTALHEVGHLLGLGESPDPRAVMNCAHDVSRTALTPDDLAGLQSLYGGGADGKGDVFILRGDGEKPATVLRRVAPRESDRLAVIDTDGDGRSEILLWSKDPRTFGALTAFFFDDRLRLDHSAGPQPGVMPARYDSRFVHVRDGRPLLLHLLGGRRYDALEFAAGGLPARRWQEGSPLLLEALPGDADADGLLDADVPAVQPSTVLMGDLDGDGQAERIEVRRWKQTPARLAR